MPKDQGLLFYTKQVVGFVLGNAAVHDKQALVLVNRGGATGRDICRLALHVIAQVQDKFGVVLEAEPRIMGANGEGDLYV